MRLNPVSKEWQLRWDKLMRDSWLRRKLSRTRRINEHHSYLHDNVPDLPKTSPGVVIDIGPGCGELLELARAWGHKILGIDAPDGAGGMGDPYVQACRLMHERQQIPCSYAGLQEWLAYDHADIHGQVVLINSRGSIEQCFADCMVGVPHHVHHRSDRLAWKMSDETHNRFVEMFRTFKRLLREDGQVVIHANGSFDTDDWYDDAIQDAAKKSLLRLVERRGKVFHKWEA